MCYAWWHCLFIYFYCVPLYIGPGSCCCLAVALAAWLVGDHASVASLCAGIITSRGPGALVSAVILNRAHSKRQTGITSDKTIRYERFILYRTTKFISKSSKQYLLRGSKIQLSTWAELLPITGTDTQATALRQVGQVLLSRSHVLIDLVHALIHTPQLFWMTNEKEAWSTGAEWCSFWGHGSIPKTRSLSVYIICI